MDFENDRQQEVIPPVEVPLEKLNDEILENIIESFILREGTDYGVVEISHERKKEQIKKQIQKGDVKVVFDFNTESVTLLTANEWRKVLAKA